MLEWNLLLVDKHKKFKHWMCDERETCDKETSETEKQGVGQGKRCGGGVRSRNWGRGRIEHGRVGAGSETRGVGEGGILSARGNGNTIQSNPIDIDIYREIDRYRYIHHTII